MAQDHAMVQKLEFIQQYQYPNHDEGNCRDPLDPNERNVIADDTAYNHSNRRYRGQRDRRAEQHRPWSFRLSGHSHGGQLRFVAHLRKKNYAKRCQQDAPVHLNTLLGLCRYRGNILLAIPHNDEIEYDDRS